MFTLCKDDSKSVLRKFSLQGHLEVEYEDGNSNDRYDNDDFKRGSTANDQGVHGNHFEVRRTRIGFKPKWCQHWKCKGQMNADTTGSLNLFPRNKP